MDYLLKHKIFINTHKKKKEGKEGKMLNHKRLEDYKSDYFELMTVSMNY